MGEWAIELAGVSKTFGEKVALHEVSLTVPLGSVVGLLGPNGAGKTTAINILSTLIRPTSGRAMVAGHDVVKEARQVRASIGLTGQYAAIDELLTGRENLVLFGRLWGMNRRRARKRADELLGLFDLADAADQRVSTYSGGMRRRVDIACGLVVPPKVVFLDEPTTGLDPRGRRDVWSLVASLGSQGITVLLTSQYLEEADALSDNIVVLDGGRVIADGSPEDLKHRVGRSYCEVKPVHPADLKRIAMALAGFDGLEISDDAVSLPAPHGVATFGEVFRRVGALDVELTDISLRKPSLDEVFLKLTGDHLAAEAAG